MLESINNTDRYHQPNWIAAQIISRGITDPKLISVLEKVPRHEFVPEGLKSIAYHDGPLSIGYQQSISQTFIVAYMTALAGLAKNQKVLEIGTGSGYQAAILGELAEEVYSVEIIEPLATKSTATLKRLGYKNVFVKSGNGYLGWQEKAPFDLIIITAAPPAIPANLLQQLKLNGKLIAPVGVKDQHIVRWTKVEGKKIRKETFIPVSFVPMTGKIHLVD